MKKTITLSLSLSEVRSILLKSLNLPKNAKFKFQITQTPDPKADVRDPSFISSVKSLKAVWSEGKNKASLMVPISDVSKIIVKSQKREGAKIKYKTKQVQDKTADIRDPNWFTVVSGVELTSTSES